MRSAKDRANFAKEFYARFRLLFVTQFFKRPQLKGTETRKMRIGLPAVALLLSVAPIFAQSPPFQCIQTSVPVPPVVRAEGHAELIGDILLNCTGGISTPPGSAVPTANITILLNTNVTSRLTSGLFTEALVLIDEPNSPLRTPVHPVLNCGNAGAPNNSGACSIISTGNPASTYDGTPNGYGAGNICDGSVGRPAPNSFGCGRPNVFQAQIGTPGNPGLSNAVTFLGVPLDPPGTTTNRILRFTNIRTDAAEIGVGLYSSAQVTAQLSVSGNTSLLINNPQQVAAYVVPGMTAAIAGSPGASSPVRLLEGFTSAWKTKNLSLTVGNNATPGNATFQSGSWVYNGGSHYPADVAENIPGAVYNAESGFQWQNNAANGPPSPDPPPGFGLPPIINGNSPLSSPNTGIVQSGVSDSGTRIALRFANIPLGASIQLPPVLYLFPQGFAHNGNPTQFQAGATGVMVLTNTDSAGAGAFSPAGGTLTVGNNLAVYEILYADPLHLEYADVPFTISNGGTNPALQIQVGFAPLYSALTAGLASSTLPLPRFVDQAASQPCSRNVCLTAFPNQGSNSNAQAPSFQCIVTTGVPPVIRPEGLAEQAADFTLNCSGGTPTLAGQSVPQANITLTFSTNVTSKVTASTFTEALLIIDEPNSGINPSRPVLNCGQTGAPDTGAGGPGVCAIVSNGNPASTYDGTANAYGGAMCDGIGGRPPANSYGCGRPNVFQAQTGTPQNPSQANAITFYNVPLDPPGFFTSRTLRITNLRVNSAPVGASKNFVSTFITASVAVMNPNMSVVNPQQITAYLQTGLIVSTTGAGGVGSKVQLVEGFASSWKAKNFSFATGDHAGTPGNAQVLPGQAYWTYNNQTNYPADIAQNVPGAIYITESIFEWHNNGTNGPPSPNPPFGTGFGPVASLGGPLNSAGAGGLNTGIANSGVANSGTRLALRFFNIPPGASIQVPQVVNLYNGCVLPCAASGVMALTATNGSGTGPYSPTSGTLTSTNNLAVYEVLWADPFSIDSADVPFTLMGAPAGSAVQVSASFAPFFSTAAAGAASAVLPVPRFADTLAYLPCVTGPCISVFPSQGVSTGTVNVAISGGPILNGASVKLSAAGKPDIAGAGLTNPSPSVLNASFNLSGAAAGPRDVVITPFAGSPFVLAGVFNVLAPPQCTFTVGPQNPTFSAAGGPGSLVVTPSASACNWSASTSTPWITLQSKSSSTVQPYTVAANASSSQRTGSISIAGQNVTISQSGACTYSISPGSGIFAVNGGMMSINVTSPSACPWTVVSNANWINVMSGTPASGTGWVTLQAAANSGAPRSGTVTIAGITFNATQNAPACGAVDVSSQVSVVRGTIVSNFSRTAYTQQIRLTNTGATLPAPVFLVLVGLPLTGPPCVGGTCGVTPAPPLTYCQSATGSSLIALSLPAGVMNAGQTLTMTLTFQPGAASGGMPPTWYKTRVFDGTPSQ
jgi:hypothetical protein